MPPQTPTRTMHITSSLSGSCCLTPAEFHKLERDAIKSYTDSVWMLADLMRIGWSKFGRNRLWQISSLSPNKVNWLAGIADVKHRHGNLTPEHHAEVVGLRNQSKWLRKAEKEKLNPVELRKKIRSSQRVVRKEKSIKVPSWSKHFLNIERELQAFTPEQRERVRRYMTDRLTATSGSLCL